MRILCIYEETDSTTLEIHHCLLSFRNSRKIEKRMSRFRALWKSSVDATKRGTLLIAFLFASVCVLICFCFQKINLFMLDVICSFMGT